jgi:hypothetical protein
MASSSNKQTIVDVYLNHVIIDGALELAVEKSYLEGMLTPAASLISVSVSLPVPIP